MKTCKENEWLHTFIQLSKRLITTLFLLMWLGTAYAVAYESPYNSNLFELDGNIADEATVGDDWQNVEDGNSSAFSTTHDEGTGKGILHDEKGFSIFTGGGSKDIRDITEWQWTHGSVPDKDEIMHAAAAAYKAGANKDELMIYLMGDRYSTDGSAQMGVWFFQERVGMNEDGTFSGKHRNGDVLMLAEFTQGGAQADIKLYKWDSSAKDNLILEHEGMGDANTFFYAISNGIETPAWSDYVPKSGTPGYYPPNAFYEGGINLSEFFGNEALPCFSSFLMETRSSHRANAQLKDFVLGDLNTCKLTVAKSCISSVVNTEDYVSLIHTYEYNVTNSGFGTVEDVTFIDDAGTPNDTSDDFALPSSGPLATGETWKGPEFNTTNGMNPPTNTITAIGHIGEYDMAPVYASATCAPVDIDANISVTKKCEQSLEEKAGYVVVRVDYDGMVCNDKNGTKLTDVWVTDDVSGDSFGPFELYPADDSNLSSVRKRCENYSGTHYPTTTVKACASNSSHTNTVTATGKEALTLENVSDMATASCRLCDGNCTEPTQ